MWVRAVETAVFAVRTTRVQALAAICYYEAMTGTNKYPGLPKNFLTRFGLTRVAIGKAGSF